MTTTIDKNQWCGQFNDAMDASCNRNAWLSLKKCFL
ncbi:hypothetical protein U7T62_002237 [Escherichia coli]|nr:hypothetical protein [Escherichia coli]